MIDYEVIGSGSSGNCVRINNFMFDIGLPFKRIHDALFKTEFIFISHVHSDHLNLATYRQVRRLFPTIKIIGNAEVAQKVRLDIVAKRDTRIECDGVSVIPFLAPHDVMVYGWTWQRNEEDYIFVTDTYTMKYAPNHKYDYLFIESNHDQHKINAIMGSNTVKKFGYHAEDGALRHLSTQDSKAFYYLHRKSKESLWVELHKSGRFY